MERAYSDSWLPTPDFCSSKMKVHPEMLLKTKERKYGYGKTGLGERLF